MSVGSRREAAGPAGTARRRSRPLSRTRPGGAVEVVVQGAARYPEAHSAALHRWLAALAAELVPGGGSLGVRFAGDRLVRRLNREYRRKDRTTDVLSFPGETTLDGRHVGDIVISVPQARRQAAAAGHRAAVELRILLLHGLLHCLGYDHETDDGAMDRRERHLRRQWIDHA